MLLRAFFQNFFVILVLLFCLVIHAHSQSRGAHLICSDQVVNAAYYPIDPNNGCNTAYGSIMAAVEYDSLCINFSGTSWEMVLDMWSDGTVDRIASSAFGIQYSGSWTSMSKYQAAGGINIGWIKLADKFPHLRLSDIVYITNIAITKDLKAKVKLPDFYFENFDHDNKVTWTITDACGIREACEHSVLVKDIKAPTPYCVSVSTILMGINPRMVELLANDYDKGAFDNCTPQAKLLFTFEEQSPVIEKLDEEHFFKGAGELATASEYNCGNAQRWQPSKNSSTKLWFFLGVKDVKISVWDEEWNTDFCTVLITNLDNICWFPDGRPTNLISVNGSLISPSGQEMKSLIFEVRTDQLSSPKSSYRCSNTGFYSFFSIVDTTDVVFYLSKEDEVLLGVNTLDLIRLQNHLDGSKPLTNVYDLIAADINNDKTIDNLDLVALRNVVLGIDTRFKNTAWRFPLLNQTIDSLLPFQYVEKKRVIPNSNTTCLDFVAVKIGDIDGDINQKLLDTAIKTRTKSIVPFYIYEAITAKDQMIDVPIYASHLKEVIGYQLRLKLKDARFIAINPHNKGNFDFAILDDNTLSVSWRGGDQYYDFVDDEELFTITISPESDGKISELISIDSNSMLPEIYPRDKGEVADVMLEVRGGPYDEVVLYQNEPNPFKGQTSIGFKLPKAGLVTLKVFNSFGREIISRSINAIEGVNIEVISADELNGVGMYIYHLKCEDFAVTRKMICTD